MAEKTPIDREVPLAVMLSAVSRFRHNCCDRQQASATHTYRTRYTESRRLITLNNYCVIHADNLPV